ncbi:MAG TPA: M23 family metallopeptidase [Rhizomicrobium sp.]|nr:M23 family metallopeptidase [Rhizomicrobium sp.]
MTARKNLERGLIASAALMLCACTSSPRSDFAWDLKSDLHRPKSSVVVEYGPKSVTLPPVQRRTLAPPQSYAAASPKPNPSRRTPGWYTPPATQQVALRNDPQPQTVDNGAVRFLWPLKGRIVSDYGASDSGERNDGINIAASPGTPIHAAASGTVSYCGNELKGFGNLVLIRHDNGFITAYAHVGDILVSRQQHVEQGQSIATTGATGDVAYPQLHFEIRNGSQRPVDPKLLLPKTLVLAAS